MRLTSSLLSNLWLCVVFNKTKVLGRCSYKQYYIRYSVQLREKDNVQNGNVGEDPDQIGPKQAQSQAIQLAPAKLLIGRFMKPRNSTVSRVLNT